MASLELQHLGKTYPNGDVAVHALDLTVADGELFVLVGPSGCGKTTVLRMVAGLEETTTGEILIDGLPVTHLPPQDRDVAMAFQHGALYPHMTVAENIGFSLLVSRVDKAVAKRRVADVAHLLELDDVLDRRPSTLSGGQQQRVAMGRAIIRDPRLFLMDEPMSNLDAKLRTEARAEIHTIQRRLATTTLYVTHDQVEAMALGDRVGVMDRGRLVQCAPPTVVYEEPASLFVAQFMGTPPMSLMLATIVPLDDDSIGLRVGSYTISLDATAEARHPSLRAMTGGRVALGLRSEVVRQDDRNPCLELSLDFSEPLGSGQLVHAIIDAPPVAHEGGSVRVGPEPSTTITAMLDAHAELDLWRPLRLAVDTSRLHLFDLESGAPIRA